MYQGRFQNQMNPKGSRRKTRRLRWGKQFVMLLCVTVLLMGFVGGSLAWLVDKQEVTNTFSYANVSCTVDGNTVTNTSDIPVYLRIAVVPDCTVGETLKNGVRLTVNPGEGWEQSGSYYVSKKPVGVDQSLSFEVEAPEGVAYNVLAEAIQSEPDSAKTEAWR